jgi:hypothetical protein
MSGEEEKNIRLGGALFAVSMGLFVVLVPLYLLMFGQPEGTGVAGAVTPRDSAAHLLGNWRFISANWQVESLAVATLLLSALVLAPATWRTNKWITNRLAMALVATGCVCVFPMYMIMLGAYLPAAAVVEETPGVFAAFQGVAALVFGFGTALVMFGLAATALVHGTVGTIASWLGRLGAGTGTVAGGLLMGNFLGYDTLMVAGPPGLITYLIGVLIGVNIWRNPAAAGADRVRAA